MEEGDKIPDISSVHTDVLAKRNDSLGYNLYAYSIAKVLTHPKTIPPLCIGILGEDGMGKSTIMRLVQNKLDRQILLDLEERIKSRQHNKVKLEDIKDQLKIVRRAPIHVEDNKSVPPRLTIWFNPSKYENAHQLLSGLIDDVIHQIADRLELRDRELFFFRLSLSSEKTKMLLKKIRPLSWRSIVGKSLIGILASVMISLISIMQQNEFWPKVGFGGAVLFSIIAASEVLKEYYKIKTDKSSKDDYNDPNDPFIFDESDFAGDPGIAHSFHRDFQRVLNYAPPKYLPLMIFIDDLDQCSPNKIVEVTSAINLIIGEKFANCIFILGIDPEIMTVALDDASSKFSANMLKDSSNLSYGQRLLDRLLDLRYYVPSLEPAAVDKFLRYLLNERQFRNGMYTSNTDYSTQYLGDKITNEIGTGEAIMTIRAIDKHIDNVFAQTLDITEELINTIKRFFITPRNFKRFVDSLRFQYIMQGITISEGLTAPSLDQLGYFTLLSMNWPKSIRWLRRSSICEKYTEQECNTDEIHPAITGSCSLSNILILEKIGERCVKEKKRWQDEVKFILDLEPPTNIWINDERFADFFKLQSTIPKENRLSAALAKGLF